jgi:hypothetical protein
MVFAYVTEALRPHALAINNYFSPRQGMPEQGSGNSSGWSITAVTTEIAALHLARRDEIKA